MRPKCDVVLDVAFCMWAWLRKTSYNVIEMSPVPTSETDKSLYISIFPTNLGLKYLTRFLNFGVH
jgi:hypothetical protein